MKPADGNKFACAGRSKDGFRLHLNPCFGLYSGVDTNVS